MSTDARDKEWAPLYESLKKSLAQLGQEDAFGDGDYWLVDDDYGGTAQKLCIHKLTYLSSHLIATIQTVLKSFPAWHVLVQLETEIDGQPTPPEGIVVYPNHVEQHWDRVVFAEVAAALGI
jgi:hypothetical protein